MDWIMVFFYCLSQSKFRFLEGFYFLRSSERFWLHAITFYSRAYVLLLWTRHVLKILKWCISITFYKVQILYSFLLFVPSDKFCAFWGEISKIIMWCTFVILNIYISVPYRISLAIEKIVGYRYIKIWKLTFIYILISCKLGLYSTLLGWSYYNCLWLGTALRVLN